MTLSPSQTETKETPEGNNKIKVMLVDDSAVIRGLLARTLEADIGIQVVSSVHNGQMAVNSVKKSAPDVIILDLEMPVMDGITALPLIMKEKPDAKVLVCSTLSRQGASISMKALALGATECLVKPTSTGGISGSDEFQKELLRLVKTLSRSRVRHKSISTSTETDETETEKKLQSFTLRDKSLAYSGKPSIVAIGSSTGGPQALFEALRVVAGINVPIVITQHMPKTFTAILAEHIEQNCKIPCHEGAQDMLLEPGHAYVAPGGFHMEIVRDGGRLKIKLNDGEQVNYCKPSVEPMMKSVIDLYGNKVLGIMLTGMGHDGIDGFKILADKGGYIIAQDELTSVVWGMPGAVALEGIATKVLPIHEIGPWLKRNVVDV